MNIETLIADYVAQSDDKLRALNTVYKTAAALSPVADWPAAQPRCVPLIDIVANDYNPNKVASPEMRSLLRSINNDGLTMPIVVFFDQSSEKYIIVDGFHRHSTLCKRGDKYAVVSVIDKPLAERMHSTVLHNEARGKHQIDLTATLLGKLRDLGQSDAEIAKGLGMEAEEVIRLMIHGGVASHYANEPYGRAWVRDADDVLISGLAEND